VRLAGLRVLGAATRGLTGSPRSDRRRLLVVRPDHLGDLLFLTPALRRLRSALPDVEVTALVGPWARPILGRNSDVDALLTWDIPFFNRRPKASALEPYVSAVRLARVLRAGSFDAALIMRHDFWWGALVAQLAGIPHRLGYAIPEVAPFLSDARPYSKGPLHEVERNLDLVGAYVGERRPTGPADRLVYPLSPEEVAEASAALAEQGVREGDPIVAIHPGAGAALKLWTPERFGAVANALARRVGARVVLTGGPAEVDLVAAVASHCDTQPVRILGKTSLGAVAAIYRRARIVVGCDSGPLHIAVAVGAPTVHLYGPIDDRLFGPWGDPERHAVVRIDLPCAPCHRLDYCSLPDRSRACLLRIQPDLVLAAAERVLAATEPVG
jgi:heptosyltransferase-2/heptosyltransferase-3